MNKVFTLPGDISLTSAVVSKIREGCLRAPVTDRVASIELVTPQDRSRLSCWALSWFSKQDAPAEVLFKVDDLDVAISEDARQRLCGKLVDFQAGRIIVRERPSN